MIDALQEVGVEAVERPLLSEALRFLKRLDEDRAVLENGAGFSKADSWLGSALARIPEAEWSCEMRWTAWLMAKRYRRQLPEEFEGLEQPERPLVDDRDARAMAREAAWAATKPRGYQARPAGTVEGVRGGFEVRFGGFNADLVKGVKALPQRHFEYDHLGGKWFVPASCAFPLMEFCQAHPEVRVHGRALSELARLAEEAGSGRNLRRVTLRQGVVCVVYPYDEKVLGVVKRIPGGKWDKREGCWVFRDSASSAQRLLAFAQEHGFEVEEQVLARLRSEAQTAGERVEASRALVSDFVVPGMRMELFPFQRAGVEAAVKHFGGRALFGDVMGLGKTLQALATAQALGAWPAVFIVPNRSRLDWLREADRALPIGTGLSLVNNEARSPWLIVDRADGSKFRVRTNDLTAQVLVVTWDTLSACMKPVVETVGKKKVTRWEARGAVAALVKRRPALVCADEAHLMKNVSAARSHGALALFGAATMAVLGCTGTAVKNRPRELVTVLEALGLLAKFGGRWKFEKRYCAGHYEEKHVGGGRVRRVWISDGASNLEELHARLRESGYIRREKKDVLGELPLIRKAEELPITNRAEYKVAAADVVRWAMDQAQFDPVFQAQVAQLDPLERRRRIMERVGEAGYRARRAEQLRRMTALMLVAARGMVPAAVEWLGEALDETTDKVLVFARHREVQAALFDAFPGAARIHADDEPAVTDRHKKRFQEDPECRLMVASMQAGTVGHTLTAAGTVVHVELPWTPGDVDQDEGRAYGRVNDAHGITSMFLLAEDTIYADLADMLDVKRKITDAVNAGVEGASGEGVAEVLLQRMVERARAA